MIYKCTEDKHEHNFMLFYLNKYPKVSNQRVPKSTFKNDTFFVLRFVDLFIASVVKKPEISRVLTI